MTRLLVVSLLLLCLAVFEASCGHCGYTKIFFRTHYTYGIPDPEDRRLSNEGRYCKDFGGYKYPIDQSYGRNTYEGYCAKSVCGDGKVHDGHYCGKGPCNIFGYNCDGGCIPGDPVESFTRLYEGQVFGVRVL